ncbi:ATP-dependent RNA helicase SrmB [Dyadobacter sp. CECT 9275]|uniref:ATP-dependent DNA helicase RecQ n=1 Tax=Dyadobacter helix TaxID=2822344 RepID=A0A916JGZ2_9BACT|nr:ATP-dependent DNA helicase RecQ [Dyadobacter sp. CECT 9275]CAG5010234.1 ATP-dependent RNA helicase SrmB [Dyadobacter sp. CECT 9275]
MSSPEYILKQYWNHDFFRPVQKEAILSVLDGNDTLLLLPTGGGKSVCFQVPVLMMEGVCIVVTPLVALMKDQVEQLKRRHISAAAIHSGMNKHEIDITLDNCIHGNTRFLYVSPERLRTDIMIERVKQMNVCLLAVDEAHCISAWGYDFRPSYLMIADFRLLIPKVPVMALTATATEAVRKDIIDKLQMKSVRVFKQSFARANLSYSVFEEENKERKLLQILKNVRGTSIVYVKTRKRTKDLAQWLSKQGVTAQNYHAGLTFKDRSDRQNAWIKNQVRVVVATNAFGMGIDKPDVRSVIHFDLPESLEAYYQEAGRAGRDMKKAYAVALFNQIDLEELTASVERKYPATEFLKRVYQALANYYKIPTGSGEFASFDFDIQQFTGTFGLPVSDTHHALKLLEEEGFVQLSENFSDPSKLMLLVDNRQLYDFQIRYPELDTFIKVILRIYGGELFSEYVRISESELAQIYYAPLAEVISKLNFLKEREIADYEPRRDKPQLTFMTPRYDATLLPLNIHEIDKRKERDRQKARSVVQYAANDNRCRTLMLLEYFNEFDASECGVCDNCLKKKKEKMAVQDSLSEEILLFLARNGPQDPRILSQMFESITERVFLLALRPLIENERITYNAEGNLTLNER